MSSVTAISMSSLSHVLAQKQHRHKMCISCQEILINGYICVEDILICGYICLEDILICGYVEDIRACSWITVQSHSINITSITLRS